MRLARFRIVGGLGSCTIVVVNNGTTPYVVPGEAGFCLLTFLNACVHVRVLQRSLQAR